MSTADFGTGRTATFAYDNLQRLTSETMAGLYTKSYTYRDISSTRTTTQIASESYTGLCSGWSNRTASYTYDAMGNITSITGRYKTTDDIQRTYTYDAQNQLLSEKIGSDTTSYTYDTAGNIRSITGPGVTKTFTYDVTGLYKITYDAATNSLTATRVASYEYDAWGNVTYSTGTMANINPLKYRGYYHDAESGFYYLQSRYYDPAIGRFVNL